MNTVYTNENSVCCHIDRFCTGINLQEAWSRGNITLYINDFECDLFYECMYTYWTERSDLYLYADENF